MDMTRRCGEYIEAHGYLAEFGIGDYHRMLRGDLSPESVAATLIEVLAKADDVGLVVLHLLDFTFEHAVLFLTDAPDPTPLWTNGFLVDGPSTEPERIHPTFGLQCLWEVYEAQVRGVHGDPPWPRSEA